MFSGIVEEAAQVVALQSDKGNLHLTMKCSFVNELKIDQSVAHNGVCLTVVSMTEGYVYGYRYQGDLGTFEPREPESGR